MNSYQRVILIVVCLVICASAEPFQVSEQDRAKWPEWLRKGISKAEEDYEAVIKGLEPIHAKPIKGTFVTDGGTGVYQGEGYKLTVFKSMTNSQLGAGWFYGPSLQFSRDILPHIVSDIRFYSDAEFLKLTNKKEENKPQMVMPRKPSD
jgi:hypothetical protein